MTDDTNKVTLWHAIVAGCTAAGAVLGALYGVNQWYDGQYMKVDRIEAAHVLIEFKSQQGRYNVLKATKDRTPLQDIEMDARRTKAAQAMETLTKLLRAG